MHLAAPSIVGELSTCSKTVRLNGQLSGADVEILIGGTTLALGKADWPDQVFALPAGTTLPVGAVVRARQRLAPDASEVSKVGATVQTVPPNLPPPVVEAPLVGCASLVVANGLSPDAVVTVRNVAGTVIGTAPAAGARAVVRLSSPVGGGQTVDVAADACGSVSAVSSPPAEPIAQPGTALEPPTLPDQPFACQRILEVGGLRPGESLVLERGDGTTVTYEVSATTLRARLAPPLDPGETLTLHAEAPRPCEALPSPKTRATVNAGPPPPPLVSTPPCPGSPQMGLSGLKPTARVRVRRGTEELLVFEAAESSQVVDLAGVSLSPGDHLVAEQSLCDQWSAPSPVDSIVTMPDPGADPRIPRPATDCSTLVRVTGVAPGSLVSIYSMIVKGRIGHTLAPTDVVDVTVSPPLILNDFIVAVADGCAAGINMATVESGGEKFPRIVRAVEGDRAVDVASCRIGALIDVRLAGFWAGSAVALDDEVRVKVWRPLVDGERVEATARWCAQSASAEPRRVERRRAVTFTRASTKGIDVGSGHWHSGRVEAIAPLGGGRALLGTEASGLWLLEPGIGATSLSHSWSDPRIHCLVRDPTTPGRWFAGTGTNLHTTAPTAMQPEVNWTIVPAFAHGGFPARGSSWWPPTEACGGRRWPRWRRRPSCPTPWSRPGSTRRWPWRRATPSWPTERADRPAPGTAASTSARGADRRSAGRTGRSRRCPGATPA
jgi:hypothetical protein